jgi:hypothetical protein
MIALINTIIQQVDFRIMLWCWLMFAALDLNRRNINRGMRCRSYRTYCYGLLADLDSNLG